jgi:hypothetical protein
MTWTATAETDYMCPTCGAVLTWHQRWRAYLCPTHDVVHNPVRPTQEAK